MSTSDSKAVVRTFAFVDLAGFTAMTEVHGDEAALDAAEAFFALTRAAISGSGQLVKTIGDAVMLAFDSPADALAVLGDLLRLALEQSSLPPPRAGLHHGPALEAHGDWFGNTVNVAARVAGQAAGGQTLATSVVSSTARGMGIATVDLGRFALRNIAEPVHLHQIDLVAPVEAMSVDPVCRMQVAHSAAAGRLREADTDYWFCSLRCVEAFAAAPERFTLAEATTPAGLDDLNR